MHENDLRNVYNFFNNQEYDSESIQQDICDGIDNSNSFLETKKVKCIESINRYVKYSKEMSDTFGTGLIFYYWSYFDSKTEQNGNKETETEYYANINDYSGYDPKILFIDSGKYGNLKEEAINSGYCGLVLFQQKVVAKAQEYIQTNKVKKNKSKIRCS
eukprot:110629_1